MLAIIAASRRRTTAFDPLSLSPALWLSDSGSDVSIWPDISGNNRHALQATTASQPDIISSARNGRQVRRFNGTTDRFSGTATNLIQTTSAASFFIVAKADTDAGLYTTLIATPTNATPWGIGLSKDGSYLNVTFGSSSTFYRGRFQTLAYGSYQLICVQYAGANPSLSNAYSARYNSTAKTLNSAGPYVAYAATNWAVGSAADGSTRLKGDIAEIIVFPSALSLANLQAVEAYLNAKWAIY